MQLKILTWHIHGSYLYYLSQIPHIIYVPVKEGRPEGYGGRCGSLPWPENLVEVPAEQVASLDLDCIIFQSKKNYLEDQHELLAPWQHDLPKIYLEHDPPREHPTDTKHVVDDPNVLLVHCTPFNNLMWDSNRTPTRVIEHGVIVPDEVVYTGEIEKGITVVNGLKKRGRRLGLDVFLQARDSVGLDLVGMESEAVEGLGEVPNRELPHFMARYRFFFNPIRYTSLGLAVCEAMMIGMPLIALATTEMATVIEDGETGYSDTRVSSLVDRMELLIKDKTEALRLGSNARSYARERFGIERFIRDWNKVLSDVTGINATRVVAA